MFLLSACAASPTSPLVPDNPKFRAWPKTAQECAARRGKMQSVTFSTQGCVFPAKDVGRVCSDSDECEGVCNAPAGAERGWTGTGTCSAMAGPSNAGNIMIDGEATGVFWFD
jgi:hypothetical protein